MNKSIEKGNVRIERNLQKKFREQYICNIQNICMHIIYKI